MTSRDSNPLIRHPFVIALSVIVIAYSGYLFGQWLHHVVN
jgi:hypothetical protein